MAGIAPTTTSTVLLASLREDAEGAAWNYFVERYRRILIGFGRAAGLGVQDAEDVAQDTLAEFVRGYRAGRYDRDKGRLRSWLMGIARHRLVDLQRAMGCRAGWRGDSAFMDEGDEGTISEIWERLQRNAVLERALELLREQSQFTERSMRAFELVVLGGVPTPEAARQCGMSEAQIYVAKNRVAGRLRALVNELTQAYEADQ